MQILSKKQRRAGVADFVAAQVDAHERGVDTQALCQLHRAGVADFSRTKLALTAGRG